MFKLIHENKKGLSLVELIVTVVILGMVVSLGGQILYQLTNFYNATAMRWEIQSAVQLACNKFETNRDSISNAYRADLLYDPIVEKGVIINDDHTFTWKDGSPFVLPAENMSNSDDPYTYMFSTPAYRASDGQYLGSFLFIREFGASKSELFLDEAGFGETPVEVEFNVARSVDSLDATGIVDDTIPNIYLTHTVSITLKSGRPDVTSYTLKTSYTLENLSNGKKINYIGGALVFDYGWLGGEAGATPMAGPAGWSDAELNSQTGSGYPESGNAQYKDPTTGEMVSVIVDTMNKSANVMRFISETAFHSKGDIDEATSSANMASCLSSYAFSDSSKLSSHALGALRDFRDNVLKGTTVGDWIIDNYYNEWSPFLVQKMGYLKPVYKVILTPVAYVCGLIANI
ncbi:MAG: Tfp pilus assembly protein FimT/FimU [Candidatus Fimenecus sp.]